MAVCQTRRYFLPLLMDVHWKDLQIVTLNCELDSAVHWCNCLHVLSLCAVFEVQPRYTPRSVFCRSLAFDTVITSKWSLSCLNLPMARFLLSRVLCTAILTMHFVLAVILSCCNVGNWIQGSGQVSILWSNNWINSSTSFIHTWWWKYKSVKMKREANNACLYCVHIICIVWHFRSVNS